MNTIQATITHDDALTRLRVRFVQALAIFSIVIIPAALIISFLASGVISNNLALPLVYMLANIGLLILVQRGHLGLATLGLITLFVVGSLNIAPDTPWILLTTMLTIITAAILGSQRIYVVASVIIFAKVIAEIVRA